MATIGRAKAVADVRGIRFAGFLAWIAWLTIHLMFLVQFQNRILVLIQWAWNYTTRNSPARLITGHDPSEQCVDDQQDVDSGKSPGEGQLTRRGIVPSN